MKSTLTIRLMGASCMAALAAGILGCQPAGAVKLSLLPADKTLKERVIIDESFWTLRKVALIDVSGLLVDDYRHGLLTEGEHPVALLTEQLHKAANDSAVEAVIIRINSPGGTVTASSLIHDEITRFKAETSKPCAALLMDVAASGGYYVACAAERIIAHRSTVTGSIGVIAQLFSLESTLTKIGVKTYAIKTGRYKDAGSPLKDLEQDEKELFQEVVDTFHEQFLDAIEAGRPSLTRPKIVALADGRIYTADQALKAGLIDQIGDFHSALDWAKQQAELQAVKVVIYHRPGKYKPNIYAASPRPDGVGTSVAGAIDLVARSLRNLLRPSFLYLWAPGLGSGSP